MCHVEITCYIMMMNISGFKNVFFILFLDYTTEIEALKYSETLTVFFFYEKNIFYFILLII